MLLYQLILCYKDDTQSSAVCLLIVRQLQRSFRDQRPAAGPHIVSVSGADIVLFTADSRTHNDTRWSVTEHRPTRACTGNRLPQQL